MRLLYQGPLDDSRRRRIAEACPGIEIDNLTAGGDLPHRIAGAQIVTGQIPPDALRVAGALRWVHSWMAGPNDQLYPDFVAHPVAFTCSRGNGAIPLAEHAMMLMLMLNRQASRWTQAQRDRRWERFTHDELNGKTLGLIGTGNSGADLARKAKAFHMTTLGLSRSGRPVEGVDEMFGRDRLHALLARADVVVVSAPLTPETEGMLGEAEFRAMKPTAHYICFSRGGIADDAVLLRALQEGWIAGAGLDAHADEPLSEDSPFWTAPNTIITPHNGATTQATAERGFDIFVDNLARFAAGRALFNLVDKTAGY